MKIFVLGDSPLPSGFGRIDNEVFTRLAGRGHEIFSASVLYDGALPHKLPFWIAGLAGKDIWQYSANLVNSFQPDVAMVTQDFPYAQTLYYNCRLDWSRRAFVVLTPVDGEPIDADWLRLVDDADATMVISRFGVEAMRRAGKRVSLCHPGVDTHLFKPATPEERQALRAKANIPDDAFVLGMAAMNQGRKAIPHTLEGFREFALDKPNALLLLDMDKVNPAGWNILKLAKDIGVDEKCLLFREDLAKRGLVEYRDRMWLMDAHSVLSHREGFGLPLLESMACRIPTLAMDWCSGTELMSEGKGYLVKRVEASHRYGTWGNAKDYDPDVADFIAHLNNIYNEPTHANAIAECGYRWAKQQTWDVAANQVEEVLLKVKEGLDARLNRRASVQSTPVRAETVPESGTARHDGAAAGGQGGSDLGGRRLDGIQPAGIVGSAAQGDPQRIEQGLRGDGEYRGEGGDGRVAPIPEQRH